MVTRFWRRTPNAMCLTRIYGRSEKSGVKSGSVRAVTIAGAWPQTQVFGFKTIFGDRLQTRQIDNQFQRADAQERDLESDDTPRNAR